jgi:hypothetical protein
MSINEILNGYTCPVCGFTMSAPPFDFNICPSCGTEFGNDDSDWTFEQLRGAWLENGARWWSNTKSAPPGWDPVVQILRVIPTSVAPLQESNTAVKYDDQPFQISFGEWGYWKTVGSAGTSCHV